ncbi:LuxR C-terminal-related transcriptional regulator [Angustibacter luteus]|uniref:LuxR C-terminal-related transcriptional regulator n=1 Tax=Angustibacter luteus TaxID=658456 RepID=A0ABW1JIR8_9ACTN
MGQQVDQPTISGAPPAFFRPPEAADLGLLASKLALPRVPPSFVPRPQVSALLDAGTRGPLTVVSAGAGWGKTLTTAGWAAAGRPVGSVAWLSLDVMDNEPRTFWSYAVAALRGAVTPPAGNPLAQLVPGLGGEVADLNRLTAGLAQLPVPVVLVLDDFQVIQNPGVLDGVTTLLRHPPPQLRLVLLTRADPVLPMHRLRVTHELVEIRPRDLAFTVSEAEALLAADGITVDVAGADLLVQRTEGWPAGLRLAALFLGRTGPQRTPADFAGDDQAVVDYLAEEVIASHPPDLQRFLLLTCISDQVSSGLAEALTEEPRSQQFLERLESTNAFVVGLGPGREWYRYHALMREMLQHRLVVDEPELVRELHRRAALWFAGNGDPLEALRHAIRAQDWPLVGNLFVNDALPLLVSVDRAALDHVIAGIPAQHLTQSSPLALCAAARLMHAGRFEAIQPYLDLAQARLEETPADSRPGTEVGLLLLSTAVARSRGDNPALVTATEEALGLLAGPAMALPAARGYRATALGNLGTGLLWSGRLDAAEQRLREGLTEADGSALEAARINMLAHLSLAEVATGRLRVAYAHATEAVEIVDARGWAPLTQAATAYLSLSLVNLRWNNLDEAQALLAQGRRAAALDRSPRAAFGLAQARIDTALGRLAAARDQLADVREAVTGTGSPTFLLRWLALAEAELDLAAGDPTSALRRIGPAVSVDGSPGGGQVHVAQAHLALGRPDRAEQVLAPMRDGAPGGSGGSEVEVWLLSALTADRLREDNRALDALRRAVEAAEPEGVRRPFVVLDPEHLPRLLTSLTRLQPRQSEFATELLADLVPHDPVAAAATELSDPLTERELSVLQFLPTMMTNTEIAAELYVSVNTVKAHLKRIYRKLDVVSRRAAVHRAHELGLLTR